MNKLIHILKYASHLKHWVQAIICYEYTIIESSSMTPIVPPDATAATLSAEAVGKHMSNRVVHLHNYNKSACALEHT